ncbi:MAG: TatD family hydrolase [Bacteroidetes bacterium]|nr:TatD family hydrolase [Bacteroidota bacterium]
MLIDTHAHIFLEPFDSDFDQVLERANGAGVGHILMPAIDVPSIHRCLELADAYDGSRGGPVLHAMAGIHPSSVKDATDSDLETVARLARDPRIVAIGETGLDYYWDRSFDARQHDSLRFHIRLAEEVDKPLVFHDRESSHDLVRIVQEEKGRSARPDRIRGVFHCFGGPSEHTERVLALGFHMGIGGTYTFKNGGIPQATATVPMDRIILETDAPYLTPAPHRGTRNEPAYVWLVAEKLAEMRGLSVEEVTRVTTENAKRLFGLA